MVFIGRYFDAHYAYKIDIYMHFQIQINANVIIITFLCTCMYTYYMYIYIYMYNVNDCYCMHVQIFTNFVPQEIFDGIQTSIVYSIMQWSVASVKYRSDNVLHCSKSLVLN